VSNLHETTFGGESAPLTLEVLEKKGIIRSPFVLSSPGKA
jgi:hypothetical protein